MAGVIVFTTLAQAINAGYQVYDRASYGYLVRTKLSGGWGFAEVHLRGAA